MRKILISGGPVPAYLDDVKIITNRFKGGWMASLAEQMSTHPYEQEHEVTYLTSADARQPQLHDLNLFGPRGDRRNLEVVHHYGFHDYMDKVLHIAPQMDAIILGAAVANLIPKRSARLFLPETTAII